MSENDSRERNARGGESVMRHKEHGRHAVYAKGKHVPGIQKARTLSLPVVQAILAEDDADKFRPATPFLVEEDKEGLAAR